MILWMFLRSDYEDLKDASFHNHNGITSKSFCYRYDRCLSIALSISGEGMKGKTTRRGSIMSFGRRLVWWVWWDYISYITTFTMVLVNKGNKPTLGARNKPRSQLSLRRDGNNRIGEAEKREKSDLNTQFLYQ